MLGEPMIWSASKNGETRYFQEFRDMMDFMIKNDGWVVD